MIDGNTIQKAAEHVVQALQRPGAEIHSVTLTANGQHGGVDLLIEGVHDDADPEYFVDFTDTHIIR